MRIIAGQFGGRRLLGPRDAATTRPITDRAKVSLFDRLASLGLLPQDPAEPSDTVALDIFCGTGTLGIEALSRGIGRGVFVERDREAVTRLKKNLQTVGATDRARLMTGDAMRAGWLRQALNSPVRIIFLDPPYALLREPAGVERLTALAGELAERAEPGAAMVLRTEKSLDPPAIPPWQGPDVRRMGTMKMSVYLR